MACVYIPDQLLGFIKILIIWFFFSCVMSIVIMVFSRQIIMDNWAEYQCNPMVTPFASVFGHDSATTMQECQSRVFHTQSTPMFGALTNVFGGLFDIGDDLMKGLSDAMGALDSGNRFTSSVFTNFLQQMENVGSTFQGLMLQIQILFSRLAASLLTIVYTMEQVFESLVGIKPAFEKIYTCVNGGGC